VRIAASCGPGEIRALAYDDSGLADVAIERPGARDRVGDVVPGRVTARRPAMAGAFVALDQGPDGFLPDSAGGAGVHDGDLLKVRVTRAAQSGKGPRLAAARDAALADGPGAVARLAALHPTAAIAVDDAVVLATLRPAFAGRLELVARAFDDALEAAFEALHSASAALPGGAMLSVYPTPALVALDLDLGAGSNERRGKRDAQAGANVALIPAIAREIRLRNLGGAIVVDLAGMAMKRRAALGPAFAAALAADPTETRFLGFSALGLAEILRTRIHPPLHELLRGPHAAGLAGLRALAREIAANPARPPAMAAAANVADALHADSAALADLARRAGRPLMLTTDQSLPPNAWRLEA
jgi:hypothetical protein